MTIFRDWNMTAAGGATTARKMPDRLAEVVNVRDFGAIGDGTNNDSTHIQDAFDAAFGTAGSPHGSTNTKLNRPVYFPPGTYACNNLVLTQVYGARIYGAASINTRLAYNGAGVGGPPLIRTDGCAYTVFENMGFACTGRPIDTDTTTTTVGFDLNCGSGGIGLHDIVFFNCGFGSGRYGIRVAENSIDGRSISFVGCTWGGATYGVSLNSDDGLIHIVGGGLSECNFGVWIRKGSCCESGASNAGIYSASAVFAGQTDVKHESSGITTLFGGRSESQNMIYITNALGKVNAVGMLHNQANVGPDALGPKSVDGTAGEVNLNGCFLGTDGIPNAGLITGSPTVSLRNVRWGFNENHFPSFTGTVAGYISTLPLTFATLPPNPADGLMVAISDANLSSPSTRNWGDPITVGGSTSHALLRWNSSGTPAWTLVGK